MTLHWWMHWFWVTSHLTGIIFALPLAQSTLQPEGTLFDREGNFTTFRTPTTEITTVSDDIAKLRDLFAQHHDKMYRIPKAIESNLQDDAPPPFNKEVAKQPLTNNRSWTTNENVNISITTTNNMTVNDSSDSPSNKSRNSNGNDNYDNRDDSGNINNAKIIFGEVFADRINSNKNKTTHRASQADSQITWITTSNATVESKPVERTTETSRITSDKLAVLPLRNARFKQASNKTTAIPSKYSKGPTLNETKEVDVGVDDVNGDFRVVVTASSVLQGMSESSRLSRAWSAFGEGVYRHDQQETQEQRQDVQTFDTVTNGTSSAIDIAAVTGSCLATLLLLGTMGSLGFVMYRKRYLNPPQTLNSDKCSNPDSSGYIDDSTIRDNSEEMYSLDNDSFLNSLEAMTIPNYWTDSVKHTKL